MNRASVRVGVGTRFLYDGDPFEVVDMQATTAGNELVLRGMREGAEGPAARQPSGTAHERAGADYPRSAGTKL